MKKLILVIALFSFMLPAYSQMIPTMETQGYFATREDFLAGKVTPMKYVTSNWLSVEFEGKKKFNGTQIYGFVEDDGNFAISMKLDKNKFYYVVLAGEIIYYSHYVPKETPGGVSYIAGNEVDGFISKGYEGEILPATYANMNKLVGADFDCKAAVKAATSKMAKPMTLGGKYENMLVCVWAYNNSKK